jgi:hypothetical protein
LPVFAGLKSFLDRPVNGRTGLKILDRFQL